MLAYRVFPRRPNSSSGEPGHPSFVANDGGGRIDNPGQYQLWYLALEPSGAIGESFGDLSQWTTEMFDVPGFNSKRALATYYLDDNISLLDLDDAQNLITRGLRPTQVVSRNPGVTQAWALKIFQETNNSGQPRWQGVQWWSFHLPRWRIVGYWGKVDPELVAVEDLSLDHPAVRDATRALRRNLTECLEIPSTSASV